MSSITTLAAYSHAKESNSNGLEYNTLWSSSVTQAGSQPWYQHDPHLGELIRMLKRFGIPIAVISNSTLLTLPAVQEELLHCGPSRSSRGGF